MVSDRIKKLRVAAGMTQEQLGEILGVGKATVQKYESGQIQNLKTSHIKKLCEIFRKKPHYFIFDELEKFEGNDGQIFENIESFYGKSVADSFQRFLNLNETGKSKAIEYVSDLCQLTKYRKR